MRHAFELERSFEPVGAPRRGRRLSGKCRHSRRFFSVVFQSAPKRRSERDARRRAEPAEFFFVVLPRLASLTFHSPSPLLLLLPLLSQLFQKKNSTPYNRQEIQPQKNAPQQVLVRGGGQGRGHRGREEEGG